MSQPKPTSCTHDVRPGTTVCLYCRQEQRAAAAANRRRMTVRSSIVAIVFVVAAAAIYVARSQPSSSEPLVETAPDPNSSGATSVADTQSAPTVAAPTANTPATALAGTDSLGATTASPAPASVPAVIPSAAKTLRSALGPGNTALGGGVVATTAGDTVLVQFDSPMVRTRRPEKFEQLLRTTLPRIYGRELESALAAIPEGGIVTGGELLTELPARGLRVPVANGGVLTIWPETRAGRDGPLVVRYRALVSSP
jgi:hypothetical protein